MESRAASRLRPSGDALGARGAGWVLGVPGAGLGRESKRIPPPLQLPCMFSHREPQLTARPSPDCPVLPVPETQLAEEQNKTTQSRSNSSPFLQSSVERCGCGSVPPAERNRLSFLQKRHLGIPQHNGNSREISPCIGDHLTRDAGFICIFSKGKMGTKGLTGISRL